MAGRLASHLEDAHGGAARERVVAVAEQICQAELEVMVVVQLPELAVDDVEVLVREEGALLVRGRGRGWGRGRGRVGLALTLGSGLG